MKKLWKILKGIIAAFLIFVLTIILYAQYHTNNLQDKMEESVTIQKLNQFESKKEYWEVFVFLADKASLLSDRLMIKNEEMAKEKEIFKNNSDLVIHWLNKRLGNGDAPYFYLISIYKGAKTKSKYGLKHALKYYAAGQLISRIDAARCKNPESLKFISMVENDFFWGYKEELYSRKEEHDYFLKWALKKEEELKERPISKWLCSIPTKFQGRYIPNKLDGDIEVLSNESWQIKRQELRKKYIANLTKS